MASLAVRCKGCGAELGTGISTGKVARPLLGPHALPCAVCGLRALYHGADFHPAPAGVGAAG
jgi:hypothetical protein